MIENIEEPIYWIEVQNRKDFSNSLYASIVINKITIDQTTIGKLGEFCEENGINFKIDVKSSMFRIGLYDPSDAILVKMFLSST